MIKLLVADDAPFIIEIVRQVLKNSRYTVVSEAMNGFEAVAQAVQTRPAIVLMDIIMPKKSGIEATREILKELPDTKIIAFSTADQETMVMHAMEAGCVDYIVKPFKAEELLRRLDKLVEMPEKAQTGGQDG